MNFFWVCLVIAVLCNAIILVPCITGVLYPALRREFVCFTAAAALHLLQYIGVTFPWVYELVNHRSIGTDIIMRMNHWANIYGNLSSLFCCVGFVFLMMRAFSLPLMRR